jgi:hypothetical protein
MTFSENPGWVRVILAGKLVWRAQENAMAAGDWLVRSESRLVERHLY